LCFIPEAAEMRAKAGPAAAATAPRQQSGAYNAQQVLAWLETLNSMQLSMLGAEWFDRGSVISLGTNLSALGRSPQLKAQDIAMLQLLCSAASKLLRFLCLEGHAEQGTAAGRDHTGSTHHGSGDTSSSSSSSSSSSAPSAAAGPRVVAASLVAHVLTAIPSCLVVFATDPDMAVKITPWVLDDTDEPMLQQPCSLRQACHVV
jgi:hypothetical protein